MPAPSPRSRRPRSRETDLGRRLVRTRTHRSRRIRTDPAWVRTRRVPHIARLHRQTLNSESARSSAREGIDGEQAFVRPVLDCSVNGGRNVQPACAVRSQPFGMSYLPERTRTYGPTPMPASTPNMYPRPKCRRRCAARSFKMMSPSALTSVRARPQRSNPWGRHRSTPTRTRSSRCPLRHPGT